MFDSLSILPAYLESMATYYPEANRLHRVADAFLQDAREYIWPTSQVDVSQQTHISSAGLWHDLWSYSDHGEVLEVVGTEKQLIERVNPYFDWFSRVLNENM